MDFQGTADTEIQALQARQQYLAALAEQRRCGEDMGEPQKVITELPRSRKRSLRLRPFRPLRPHRKINNRSEPSGRTPILLAKPLMEFIIF
jgi:hypothetical protein